MTSIPDTVVPLTVMVPVTSVDLPVASLSTSPAANCSCTRYCTNEPLVSSAVSVHAPSTDPVPLVVVALMLGLAAASERMRNQYPAKPATARTTTTMTTTVATPPRARALDDSEGLDMGGEPCTCAPPTGAVLDRGRGSPRGDDQPFPADSGAARGEAVLDSRRHAHLPGHHHFVSGRLPAFASNRPLRWAVFCCRGASRGESRPIGSGSSAATASAPRSSPRRSRSSTRPVSRTRPWTTTSAARATSRTGEVLPDVVLEELRGLDAILLGAVGTPEVPPGVLERGLLLKMRFELDLYVNLRPFLAPTSELNDGVDMVVIRENTEGTYAGEGGFLRKGTPARDRHPGVGEHPDGRRALRPVRVRPRPDPGPRATSRWCTRRTSSPSPVTSGSATFDEVATEYPRRDDRLRPHRCGLHPLRAAARSATT